MEYIPAWQQWLHMAFSLVIHLTGEELEGAISRVLCQDTYLNPNRSGGEEYLEGFKAWHKILMSDQADVEKIRDSLLEDYRSKLYFCTVMSQTDGRTPCATENGYLAIVPAHTQPGDRIVLLTGGWAPFVLRPC
jgi:hypothetical protein